MVSDQPSQIGVKVVPILLAARSNNSAEVVEQGGKMVGEVVTHEVEGAGLLTFVYVADPEGNIIRVDYDREKCVQAIQAARHTAEKYLIDFMRGRRIPKWVRSASNSA